MLSKVHDHIVSELGQSSRTDTIFVVTTVIFNLIVLGINTGVSAAAADEPSFVLDLVLVVFIAMTVLMNGIAVVALTLGRRTRSLLLEGLVSMYEDHEIAQYYDPSLLSNYGLRYMLFAGVILTLALTAIIVPLIIRFA